jgi:hypothetical protein
MKLASFNPAARTRLIAESDHERELLELFRRALEPDRILRAAREAVSRDRPLQVTMEIQRLNRGPVRTFWMPVRGGFSNITVEGRTLGNSTVGDIQRAAEAHLTAFLAGRNLPTEEPARYEMDDYHHGVIRKGRYRAWLFGTWSRQEWMHAGNGGTP